MKVLHTIEALRNELAPLKRAGKVIGLVPTMGALHEGHTSLIDACVSAADCTVVSVFLNPIQFGKNEDLDKYPKKLEADAKLAEEHGAAFVFAPAPEEMYPAGDPLTLVRNEKLEGLYCGQYRKGHFRGVLTVVAKLFLISGADLAVFGEKDYQQLFLVKQMVNDLNFPVKILSVPTVREPSGLALSSRNDYLPKAERKKAAAIYEGLKKAKAAYDGGERFVSQLRDIVIQTVLKSGGNVQYVEIASAASLKKLVGRLKDDRIVILVAAIFGTEVKTRLIDNIELGGE